MPSPRDWVRLQQAAEAEIVRRAVRLAGIGCTAWGAINALAGVVAGDAVLLALGAGMLATGVWMWARPGIGGLLASAVTIAAAGIYNLAGTLLAPSSGAGPFVMFGVMQLMWAAGQASRWRRFKRTSGPEVTEAEQLEARAMLEALRKARLKTETDVVAFDTTSFPPANARARLLEDGALVVIGAGADVHAVSRAQFALEPAGQPGLLGSRKARLRIGAREWPATLTKEQWARYEAWSAGPVARAA
jgi:hypothetical protein